MSIIFLIIVIVIIVILLILLMFFLFINKKHKNIKTSNKSEEIQKIEEKDIIEKIKKKHFIILENTEINFSDFNYKELNKNSSLNLNSKNLFEKLELFLKNYKYVYNEKLKTHISIYIKNNKSTINNDKKFNFLNYLTNTFKLGVFILNSLDTQDKTNIKNYIYFFKQNVNNLFLFFKKEKKSLSETNNWKDYVYNYVFILFYFILIDNKIKDSDMSYKYLSDIEYYIPKINFFSMIKECENNSNNFCSPDSKLILNKSESQNFFMLFLMNIIIKYNKGGNKEINIFLQNIKDFPFDFYFNNYVIDSGIKKNTEVKNGLYPNGGYINDGICHYSYILESLYYNLFLNLFFDSGNESISRILKSIFKIINFKIKKCNPVIVSKNGDFNELYNTLLTFNTHVQNLKVFKNNKEIELLNNYLNGLDQDYNYLNYIDFFDIINVSFDNWCIQIKNNNNFGYAEIDNKKNNIFKQIYMNKIILFQNINLDVFLNHSKYPGVLFYKEFKDNAETISPINNKKQILKFEKSFSTHGLIFENLYFIYNEVTNKELKIEYKEIILFLPEGIVVGYFDIIKYLKQDLYLCLNNNLIYQNKIFFGVLYDNLTNNKIINENNKYNYIKINKDIIYYNFYIDKLFKINFYNNKNSIIIVFVYKKKNININIKKNKEILIEIF